MITVGLDALPVPPTRDLGKLEFVGERESIGNGDNWAMTWGDDGRLFAYPTDTRAFALAEETSSVPVVITGRPGRNPPDLGGHELPTNNGRIKFQGPRESQKVSGLVMIDGVLYAWLRNLNPPGQPVGTGCTLMSSSNHGRDWDRVDWSIPELGYPAWLNAGQNYADHADGYAYFISPDGPSAYADYADLVMGRVPTGAIRDRGSYEFFAGFDADQQLCWSTAMASRRPVFSDPAGVFRPDLIYNPGLGRYLLLTASPAGDWSYWWANDNPDRVPHLGIFESEHPWGPWRTLAYIRDWGDPENRFTPHISPKWISPDGRELVLVYSCIPEGPYRFNAQRCRLG